MSNYTLRLLASLKAEAKKVAEEEGATLNQFINVAVAEKLAALRTARYFQERAAHADLKAFCREKGIAEWYSKIPGLLESHFPNLEGIEFSLQEDDESEDVFVEVLFSVAGDPEEIGEYYDIFLGTWIEEVPAEARAYFQLLLDIVE